MRPRGIGLQEHQWTDVVVQFIILTNNYYKPKYSNNIGVGLLYFNVLCTWLILNMNIHIYVYTCMVRLILHIIFCMTCMQLKGIEWQRVRIRFYTL